MNVRQSEIILRRPSPEDGVALNNLVALCPPLDPNSIYCNLLQCSHFAGTSIAAEMWGKLAGFVSGYLIPGRNNTLFVWQVAVGEQARGKGLATLMIDLILRGDACEQVKYLETTITESNEASWALFRSIARKRHARFETEVLFESEAHFQQKHDSEVLVRIGPF